jgi:two-component system CheB/CheR fusion protein
VLADPPFSGIDLVSCRNLLIYLQPQAQHKILSFFHFALRDRGVLFLGGSEAVGSEERFEAISKKHRIYRHVGRSLPGEIDFPTRPDASGRSLLAAPATPVLGQAFNFADLSQRALFDAFELSSALIDVNHECLHFSGRADKYLQITAGDASRDILAMVRDGLRPKLRAAIERASRDHARTTVNDAYLRKNGRETPIAIIVEPVTMGPKGFLLVSFLNHPFERPKADRAPDSDRSRAADAEREIQDLHHELKNALCELDNAKAEEKRIQEQAMSLNEEAQSTNEELVTSKEELQSLNEELTALNNQLQESLERQRNTSNDLQNILESSGIATIFLDRNLNIRFFTPAAKTQFRIISADIGRPLADFTSLTSDRELIPDALQVLSEHLPIERDVPAQDAVWYRRLILPYRTQEGSIEGVVITFMDITENRRAAEALAGARQTADRANLSKSRFLAAASHDLRQPLQTILLIQGLLSTRIKETEAQKLLKRLDASVSVMSGMLNTLLDINQLEAGVIQPEIENFPLNGMFEHLKADFSYHMEAQGLSWRVLQSKCVVRSDPRLLEQIVRNLLANAVKFTSKGKVLLGCRRHKEMMHIEVWDTGPGIPDEHRRSIFEEFHQVDNPARERSKGLGLGLAIVERLSHLLGHAIDVRSQVGRGSMFSIAVPFQPGASDAAMHGRPKPPLTQAQAHATILMIDDDPTIRELLDMLLRDAGYRSISASDGAEAFASSDRPDLIIADFNLPNGPNGVDIVAKIREKFNNAIPAIVLTGDISTATLGAIARQGCTHVDKPVDAAALLRAITHLLASSSPIPSPPESKAITTTQSLTIFVVDDDAAIRDAVRDMMEANGWSVETFENCKAFLKALRPGLQGCLVVDAMLPGMDGFDLLARLKSEEIALPSIMITGHGDIAMAVRAMRDGASDFLEKPFSAGELIASINQALGQNRKPGLTRERHADAVGRLAGLTPRQHQILALVLAGQPSKNIASDLGLSQRTVENHRAAIMRKTGSRSIPALIRIAVAAN